jgi:hypothetical protein
VFWARAEAAACTVAGQKKNILRGYVYLGASRKELVTLKNCAVSMPRVSGVGHVLTGMLD